MVLLLSRKVCFFPPFDFKVPFKDVLSFLVISFWAIVHALSPIA